MNIFYMEWNSLCNEDMLEVLLGMGHHVIRIPFQGYKVTQEEIDKLFGDKERKYICDFVFSFNYFPNVSNCCKEREWKYVSWVYDSPHIHAYSYTVMNACNYVFLFDYAMYEELHRAGIGTVHYLPLAVNTNRFERMGLARRAQRKYVGDISFVGSLYTEKRHRSYDKFQNISEFAKGYLEGLVCSQLQVQGYNFLQEMLTPDIVAEMEKVYPTDPNAATVMMPEAIYADYVLARHVTAVERMEILKRLGEKYKVNLYTHDEEVEIPGVINCGPVDYCNEMPYVFYQSKINLNITLRSIKTGVPLHALDIMGCGGFLMTNYQPEMFRYFEADKDFVYYGDYEELGEKTEYYLRNEVQRQKIAEHGRQTVKKYHNLKLRVQDMLDAVMEGHV